eukprot:8750133-Pyramimonas_sp.AAC.1
MAQGGTPRGMHSWQAVSGRVQTLSASAPGMLMVMSSPSGASLDLSTTIPARISCAALSASRGAQAPRGLGAGLGVAQIGPRVLRVLAARVRSRSGRACCGSSGHFAWGPAQCPRHRLHQATPRYWAEAVCHT